MTGIIVVFPNKDNATNIRNLLARGGMDVIGVCTTGAQAMHYADTVDDGIVVCGYRMKDIHSFGNIYQIRLRCFWWHLRISGAAGMWKEW